VFGRLKIFAQSPCSHRQGPVCQTQRLWNHPLLAIESVARTGELLRVRRIRRPATHLFFDGLTSVRRPFRPFEHVLLFNPHHRQVAPRGAQRFALASEILVR
jgi:hypothetical protein